MTLCVHVPPPSISCPLPPAALDCHILENKTREAYCVVVSRRGSGHISSGASRSGSGHIRLPRKLNHFCAISRCRVERQSSQWFGAVRCVVTEACNKACATEAPLPASLLRTPIRRVMSRKEPCTASRTHGRFHQEPIP